jgi:hypothetical protein
VTVNITLKINIAEFFRWRWLGRQDIRTTQSLGMTSHMYIRQAETFQLIRTLGSPSIGIYQLAPLIQKFWAAPRVYEKNESGLRPGYVNNREVSNVFLCCVSVFTKTTQRFSSFKIKERGSVTKANESGTPNPKSAGSRPEHCLKPILFIISGPLQTRRSSCGASVSATCLAPAPTARTASWWRRQAAGWSWRSHPSSLR